MKKTLYLIFYLLLLFAYAEGEEIDAIAHLVQATAKQLESQKILQEHMQRFAEQKQQFLAGDNPKITGAKLVESATAISRLLKQEHLTTLVSQEYLDEIQFFTTLRKGI